MSRPTAPVCQTLSSQIQSKPDSASRSNSAAGISSSVTGRREVRASSVSHTRVLTCSNEGYRLVVMGPPLNKSVAFLPPRQPVRESARNRIRRHDQNRPDNQCRAGIRNAENQPLAYRIYQDAHQQEVHDGHEGVSHHIAPEIALEQHRVEIRRQTGSRIGASTANAQNDRDQGLQDETKLSRTGEPLGDVLEERAGK